MSTGMRATNPKFAKSVRKPKKTEHCTIPECCREKVPTMRSTNVKLEQTILNRGFPKDEVWGNQIKKLQGKGRQQLRKKEERVWVILT